MRLVYEPILPNEYTRLEYLEAFSSIDVAYISIPYTPNTNTNFETKVRYNIATTNNTWAMGSTVWWGVHLLGSDGKIGIANSSGTVNKAYGNYTFGTDAILKLDGNSVYVNGELVGTITKSNSTSTLDLFRYYGGSNLWWNGRIYYLKIDDGTTKINLIPALRNSDSEPGMYDTVSGTFYTNIGAGTFNYKVVDNDDDTVDNPKYQQVEYLEATGTQYILSGFTPTLNTDYEVTLSSTSTGQNRWVMGCPTWVGIHYKGLTNEVGVTCNSTSAYQQYVSYTHDDSKLTMTLKGNTVYANGVELGTITKLAGTLDFALFGYRDPNQGATLNYVGKIYRCLIKNNGIPVRNFIPVIRKIDNKPGMYDKVTGQFFTNVGSGDDFLYGNKINQPLPKMYEKLEYLETTNQQNNASSTNNVAYIDTGVLPDATTKFECKAQFTTLISGNSNEALFGTTGVNSSDPARMAFGFASISPYTNFYMGLGTQNLTTSVTRDTNIHIFTVDASTSSWKIDDTTGTFSNPGEVSGLASLYLFARNYAAYDYANKPANAKVYYCKIWQNNTIVRDLVPALRKSDNKPGLYDFATGQFFTNVGSGEFTYDYPVKPLSNSKLRLVKTGGYDVIDDLYKRVDYLESTGTQYIDTGLTSLDVDTIFESTFAVRTVTSSGNVLYGADSILTGIQNGKIVFTTIPAVAETFYKTRLEYTVGQNRKIYVNDEYIGEASNYHATYPIYLFGLGASQSVASIKSFMIKETKITLDGQLVRDYIPVIRMGDNKPGMYDKKNRVFYTNAGTGEFTYPTPSYVKPLVTRLIAGGHA